MVTDLISAYLQEHVATRVVAKRRQANALAHINWHLRLLTLGQVGHKQIASYVASRQHEGIADATIRRELSAFKAALQHAVRTGRIAASDVPHIPLPAASRPRDFWLTAKETEALIQFALTDYDGPVLSRPARFVLLALGTAARRASIEKLTWDLVHFENRLVRFDLLPGPRTKKRKVPVPIADWLLPHLQEWRAKTGCSFVIGGEGGEIALEGFLSRAVRATGLEVLGRVYPHALRHTVATLAIKSGASIYEVAKLLGDTVQTVEATYAHHMPDHLSAAVNWRKTA